MKKMFALLMTGLVIVGCSADVVYENTTVKTVSHTVVRFSEQVDPLDTLIDALCVVESKNSPKAKGDYRHGRPMAIGVLQLWDIYVDDVNRFAQTSYTSVDRWDPIKSREITKLYLIHYGKRYTRLTGKPCTFEVLARIHNGGPNGWKKEATKSYWKKVQKVLDK